jgi:hypothetical protein
MELRFPNTSSKNIKSVSEISKGTIITTGENVRLTHYFMLCFLGEKNSGLNFERLNSFSDLPLKSG